MPPTPCKRCNTPHPKCAAHRRDGQPCGKYPLNGQNVCRLHGGSAPQAKKAAARRQALADAQTRFTLPITISPEEALLNEVHYTAGHVHWLRTKVAELADNPTDHGSLTWGTTETRTTTSHTGTGETTETQAAKPSIWYELYSRERKHLVDVCKTAIAAGIEERRVKLAEQQGELLANVIKQILNDLDLTPAQHKKVATVVPRHLRAVNT